MAVTALLCIGEPLVELRLEGGELRVGVGGDMLNVAARVVAHGTPARLLYVRGEDGLGDWLLQQIHRLGVDSDPRVGPGKTGLYSISTSDVGARSFTYWRSESACAGLSPDDTRELPDATALMVSGITQALSDSAEAAVNRAVDEARRRGMTIAFDPNVRPDLWRQRGGLAAARRAAESLLDRVDLFLPSVEDCAALWGGSAMDEAVAKVDELPVDAVVKAGAEGVWIRENGQWHRVPASKAESVVDTTGAGDAFNAAFLNARLKGLDGPASAREAVIAAARTVAYRGALSDLCDPAPPPRDLLRPTLGAALDADPPAVP